MTRSYRHLYLTRHGEAAPDGTLTAAGERQAALLGARLRGVPLTAVHHGPLPRVRRTAELVTAALGDGFGGTLVQSEEAGDYVPHVPERGELPADSADLLTRFVASAPAADRERDRRWPGRRWPASPDRSRATPRATNCWSPTPS